MRHLTYELSKEEPSDCKSLGNAGWRGRKARNKVTIGTIGGRARRENRYKGNCRIGAEDRQTLLKLHKTGLRDKGDGSQSE
jgi:hypothetical protein